MLAGCLVNFYPKEWGLWKCFQAWFVKDEWFWKKWSIKISAKNQENFIHHLCQNLFSKNFLGTNVWWKVATSVRMFFFEKVPFLSEFFFSLHFCIFCSTSIFAREKLNQYQLQWLTKKNKIKDLGLLQILHFYHVIQK